MRKVRHIGKKQRVRCEAICFPKNAIRRTGDDPQCKQTALYRINGKNLCRKHAQVEALALLADETEVKIINQEKGC